MHIHILTNTPSILSTFLQELRDPLLQKDRMRFRKNISRIWEFLAIRISTELEYHPIHTTTPLWEKASFALSNQPVICSILRAGLALHEGFLEIFDHADSGFVSAYRHHHDEKNDFTINIDYLALPNIQHKTLIVIDPMLATGQSIVATYERITKTIQPKEIHIACVLASPEWVAHVQHHLPKSAHLWIADMDDGLDTHKYIIPGFWDAGDLSYGLKI